MTSVRSTISVYASMAAMVVKTLLVYNAWVWTNLVIEVIALTVFYNFWIAVYNNVDTIAGLEVAQTLNYIVLARILMPLSTSTNALSYNGVSYFARLVREGELLTELLRPVDFQLASFLNGFAKLLSELVLRLPLVIIGIIFFNLTLPTNPVVWLAFIMTMILGYAVIFFFDWIISCAAFYTTETWGINMMRDGIASFLSGALIPLAIMPEFLSRIAEHSPFAQALYFPISLLSGLVPVTDIFNVIAVQLIWLVCLIPLSRFVFNLSARRITIQGG